jgi:hypothetical protein
VCNVYKPPNSSWPDPALPNLGHPALYTGDYNSHHTSWGYTKSDYNGEKLCHWADSANALLVLDLKSKGTFKSARWGKEYNPDLVFSSLDEEGEPLPVKRTVLGDFPNSQHRPVLVEVGLKIPVIESYPVPRWNFNKADWKAFANKLDDSIRWIPPLSENCERFQKLILTTAKKCIPRGFRKKFIPGWNSECESAWHEYNKTGDRTCGHNLIKSLNEARLRKWEDTVGGLNFTHSSRKAWHVLTRLTTGVNNQPSLPKVSANAIATRIVNLSKAPSHKLHTKKTRKELKELKSTLTPNNTYSGPVTVNEIVAGIKQINTNKACGADGIFPEFLKYCGSKTQKWLANFYSHIINTGKIPSILKRAKIIAILKPGKQGDNAESYRPIALLSVIYKLLERVIYNRIADTINMAIPKEQAGFRPNRNCCDQVLALTSFIERGYEASQKTSVAFIDLSAAYDTVWRQGLLYKLIKLIPCQKILKFVENSLTNRVFQVHLGNSVSNIKTLNNGLPQGSVLAPLLFNVYTHDLPATDSRKFAYADDIALGVQNRDIRTTEAALEQDLLIMNDYFSRWRLCPNANKTEVCCFHLNNKLAKTELNVEFMGKTLKHNPNPKYLGVTLDRSLTYKSHLNKTAGKLRTRNNIVQKLTGTTWGANAACLRTTALALVYSSAEFCSPVWINSTHVSAVDTQLNQTMRLITGCIRPTPTYWLPALSNIAPPHLRREQCLYRELDKIRRDPNLPIHDDVLAQTDRRLKSRDPPLARLNALDPLWKVDNAWLNEWQSNKPPPDFFELRPRTRPPGFTTQRRVWCLLNRFRTDVGNSAYYRNKWGWCESAACGCGEPEQTIRHMVLECPNTKFGGNFEELKTLTRNAVDYFKNSSFKF